MTLPVDDTRHNRISVPDATQGDQTISRYQTENQPRSQVTASWGQDVELLSNFSGNIIKGDEEKEVYLLMMVHGIGSNIETQKTRESELHASLKKVIKGGFFECEY